MSYQSIDDLLYKLTVDKKYSRYEWNKQSPGTTGVAGRWYDFSSSVGNPGNPNAWAGTALTWRTCNESTGNGTQVFGIPHGGNVSPGVKSLLNASAIPGLAAVIPGQLMLVDLQGYWPGISTNSASVQNLSGTPSLRYANGNGCRLYFVSTVASGATAHSISVSYTNSNGTSGRALPVPVSMTVSAVAQHVSHSGVGGSNYGPFLPLANGDTGVQNVASVTFSAASGAGTGALCLARPLATLPLVTLNYASERDYLNQLPSLPRIYDGACLVWLYFAGAAVVANSPITGHLEFGWS
jgi:hypothetical protein